MLIPSITSYERKAISPSVHKLLCLFANPDPSCCQFPIQESINEIELIEALNRNGLMGLAYPRLNQWNLDLSLPRHCLETIRKSHQINVLGLTLLYQNIANVLRVLNQSSIPYIVIKGPALGYTVYPDPNMRYFNDLDIIVHTANWSQLDRFLTRNGFTRIQGNSDPPPNIIPQGIDHESKYLDQHSHLLVEIHYDDIFFTGLAARDVEGIWSRTIPIVINGVSCVGLSNEDQLIQLCTHLHGHRYGRLNWFADITMLLFRSGNRINWQKVVDVVQREEIQVPVYFSLYFTKKLIGIELPEELLKPLRPDAFRLRCHEILMPEYKVLNFGKLPEIVYSFYFIPLYRRLIPDFILMGRRKEKMLFLIHLVYPSKEWIRYYYHLTTTSHILFYRLSHPLRLIGVYLRETLYTIIGKNILLNPDL